MGNSRIGRLQGLAYDFGVFLIAVPFIVIEIWLALRGRPDIALVLDLLITLFILPVQIMFAIRRLHDMGANGYWALIQVPMSLLSLKGILGLHPAGAILAVVVVAYLIFFIYALILLFTPGTAGDNRYGPPPPPNSTWVIVGAIAAIVLPVVGFIVAIGFAVASAGSAA
jgi:uncharacterized membrane protein YhaH (DUF805 family)